ncbi:hypothetical protein PVK06_001100 [Gossypium arboreum]|uniref:Wall-associated receptor kinase galacturonan-binding domain-containing protein n=1 Tax=Gossypium arboreum TaxID=29729 RepID=A0ABR0R128_GOSAR|nr:hypothetical protein PVK06_001100 [Gossypium arboreum]
MPKPKPQFPIYALVATIIVSPNYSFQSYVAKTRNKYCNPIVCKNVTVSYLFPLPTRPSSYNNHRFELDCDNNNRIVLSLNRDRFYIQIIWYEYSTTRAIDPD